jgi:hypothetical protein
MSDVEDRLPRLMDRLDALKATYAELAADEDNPTETGRTCLDAQSDNAYLYPARCADPTTKNREPDRLGFWKRNGNC